MSSWRPIRPSLESIAVGVFAIVTVAVLLQGIRVALYPSVGLLLGSVIAWVAQSPREDSAPRTDARFIAIPSFLLIATLVALAWVTPTGVPDMFYVLVCIITGLLTLWMFTAPSLKLLVPVLLFSIAIRASYWHSAPVFGRDLMAHVAVVKYIVKTGTLIPEQIYYYQNYPIGHTLVAAVKYVTGMPLRVAYFMGIGLAVVAGILVTVTVARRILSLPRTDLTQVTVLAALYLSVSPFHLLYSTMLIVQSLMLLFVPLALYAFVVDDRRLNFLGLFVAGVLIITHNAPVLVVVAFGVLYVFTTEVGKELGLMSSSRYLSLNSVFIVLIALVQYWIQVGFFNLQFTRVFRLFTPGGSLSAETSGGPPPILLDPLLHIAGGLILGGASLFATLFILLRGSKAIQVNYYTVSTILYAGFGASLIVGWNTNVHRLVPVVTLFAAPIIGVLLMKLGHQGRKGVSIAIVFVLLFPTLILGSVLGPGYTPGGAPTEDRPERNRLYLSSGEIAGAQMAASVTSEMHGSNYIVNAIQMQDSIASPHSDNIGYNVLTKGWNESCTQAMYVRDFYEPELGVEVPKYSSVVLDIGRARLNTCEK